MSFPQPSGTGTVTSLTQGGGVALSPNPIVNSGTVALATIPPGELYGNPGTAAAVGQGIAIGSNVTLSPTGTISVTGGSAVFHGARVINDGTQITNSGTSTKVAFNTNIYDTDSIHNTGTNNTRFTVGTIAGHWRFSWKVSWHNSASTTTQRISFMSLNGGTVAISGAAVFDVGGQNQDRSHANTISLAMSANDFVELWFFQNSGGTLAIGQASTIDAGEPCSMEAIYIGP